MKAGDLGEERLITHLCQSLRGSKKGEGQTDFEDDCAVIDMGGEYGQLLFKTDSVVEDYHFTKDELGMRVGWKALARVVSDFAAMGGGEPLAYLVALAIRADCSVAWLEDFYRGMEAVTERFGGRLVGGETSSVPANSPHVITISGIARAGRLVQRSGGKAGDALFVTGCLGGSLTGHHLDFTPRLMEGAWLAECGFARAMMDLSDGLGKDLPCLAKASNCGFAIDRLELPLRKGCLVDNAMQDGEDYELLFACPREEIENLQQKWRRVFPEIRLTKIGTLTKDEHDHLSGGWEHFVS